LIAPRLPRLPAQDHRGRAFWRSEEAGTRSGGGPGTRRREVHQGAAAILIDPLQIEHRRDPADRVIVRHGVGKAERVEKLPLILVEPPHHHAPLQKTFLQTPNHRSTPTSTDFCNKIRTKPTRRPGPETSVVGGRPEVQVSRSKRHF
jgi:hypothetical protein